MKRVYVFQSNEAGIPSGVTAKLAYEKYGSRYGKSYGHYGDSFAIPTEDQILKPIQDIDRITAYVYGFFAYAIGHKHLTFQISYFTDPRVRPLFDNAPSNCIFGDEWI